METDKKIPVQITVTGIHKPILNNDQADSAMTDETKEIANGFFSKRNSSIYLVYSLDQDAAAGQILRSMIKINSQTVEIKRTVSLSEHSQSMLCSNTVYEEGRKRTGVQDTPYGKLDTLTFSKSIVCKETAGYFICTVTGTMYINNSPSSEFELKIEAVMI